jgi:outer membrane protein
MFKKITIVLLSLLPLGLMAQNATDLKFGQVNSQEVLMVMPQMKDAQTQLEALAKQYESELSKMNDEYEKKGKDFMALKNVDDEIKKTRQAELAGLEQRIDLMKQTANEQIQKKQEALIAPVIEMVKKAIKEVGDENGFFYIFDMSVPAIVYASPKSTDVTPLVKKKLNIPANAKPISTTPTAAPASK